MPQLKFKSLAETEQWARGFARGLSRPMLVLLNGEMGAGKTQLVKWFTEALGGSAASSPTFAIHQSYEASLGPIEHVDLYRLENAADLESTGFWDLFKEPNALIFVEWAERIAPGLWPEDFRKIVIEISKDGAQNEARLIQVSN